MCDHLTAKFFHEGDSYCALHYPSEDKEDDFGQALEAQLREEHAIDLRNVWVPSDYCSYFKGRTLHAEVDFSDAIFNGSADFFETTFCSASFRAAVFCAEASFSSTFRGKTIFDHATFCEAARFRDALFTDGETLFVGTTFCQEANFNSTVFDEGTSFSRAAFCEDATFSGTKFHKVVDFQQAHFQSKTRFQGTRTNRVFQVGKSVNFRNVQIEEPASFSFHAVDLRLAWFVDVDPSEFRFTDVEWYRLNSWYRRVYGVVDELKVVENLGGLPPAFLLESACRGLAVNYEAGHRYGEASLLRYSAMDARRKQGGGIAQKIGLAFWYWLLSGYGELQGRALLWVGLILVSFASFYTFANFPSDQNLAWSNALSSFWQALIYSLGVMTRQRLTVEPEPGLIQSLVIVEGILGPLQIALFALAIRRKFIN